VAGPGALSQRTDLQGSQPIRVATGLPYGEAGKQRMLQQQIALPETNPLQAPAGAVNPSGNPPNATSQPVDPRQLLSMVGGHFTDYPEQPLGAPQPKKIGQMFRDMLVTTPSRDVEMLADMAERMDL
jgi:hypothetical protein